MAIAVKDLIEAGVHYGHRASRWNPKMKPYIYGKRNLIHIIDLKETVRGLLRATKYFNRVAAGGGLILFVGTKRQAVDIVVEHATKCGMPYVTERWLGGTLTNFQTIRSRLDRLDELEQTLDSDMALTYSKKALSTLNRERRKISRNLEGIRHMTRRPEAMFVIDPHREKIAVSEARKLGVKVVALMDTDCDPDVVDLPIPGNDDSMRAIELILDRLTAAIIDGKAAAPPEAQRPEPGQPGGQGQRGRLERRGSGPRPGDAPGAPVAAPGAPASAPAPAESGEATASAEPAPPSESAAEPQAPSAAPEAPSSPEATSDEPQQPPAQG
ncbi:30S ribosomal protein S2 [Tautonia rosea]|uniref:30S ribosomal protein S2 n=1 Tax=Tautonia rosea TaxID=2728037 RepID=UPI001602460C|nr:30S ribosomal protein S2 [Tautonia rosea]